MKILIDQIMPIHITICIGRFCRKKIKTEKNARLYFEYCPDFNLLVFFNPVHFIPIVSDVSVTFVVARLVMVHFHFKQVIVVRNV